MSRKLILLVLVLFIGTPVMAKSGWLGDAVNQAVQDTGRRKVQEKVDEAADTADDKAHQSLGSGEGRTQKEEAGQGASEGQGGAAHSVSGGAQGTSAPATAAADEKLYSNYDFIPGDKVIFYDDFSDTDVGEFPVRWTMEGPSGGGGTVEVVSLGDRRYLHSKTIDADWGQETTVLYLRLTNLKDLPKKFTIEFDAVLGRWKNQQKVYGALMVQDDTTIDDGNPGTLFLNADGIISKNNKSSYTKDDNKLHHISIMVNDTFMKAYVDGDRVINDPDAVARPITHVGICLCPEGANQQDKLMFTNFRLAEGGKDIKSALATDGRIIVHGIQFDTGSDKIRPESHSTLMEINSLLVSDPKLKFRIEGHTDNQGGAKLNQPLSEKRAASVKTWLTRKGIDPARLSTAGFGDTRPLGGNDTAEGRANNRRVEFVKM